MEVKSATPKGESGKQSSQHCFVAKHSIGIVNSVAAAAHSSVQRAGVS